MNFGIVPIYEVIIDNVLLNRAAIFFVHLYIESIDIRILNIYTLCMGYSVSKLLKSFVGQTSQVTGGREGGGAVYCLPLLNIGLPSLRKFGISNYLILAAIWDDN